MPYPALPDHRMPWDIDGTLVYHGTLASGAATAVSSADRSELNDQDYTSPTFAAQDLQYLWFFFPEQREVTGIYIWNSVDSLPNGPLEGSNDTTNGMDGTWEAASLPGGWPTTGGNLAGGAFGWRSSIKAVSFAGPKKNLRVEAVPAGTQRAVVCHLYGEPAAGQMAHDLIFLDPDLGAGVAFPAAEDFGDQPLGTTVVRPFRVKNTSASRTATNINLQCNDADFTIGESSSGPWVATINIASLAAGAESATLYTKCTTPAPGAALAPRAARIVVTCDAGFFG